MRTSITFQTEADKCSTLDAVARTLNQDRSSVINQALDAWLDVHRWQVAHIEEGQRQARNREFVTELEWRRAFERHRP